MGNISCFRGCPGSLLSCSLLGVLLCLFCVSAALLQGLSPVYGHCWMRMAGLFPGGGSGRWGPWALSWQCPLPEELQSLFSTARPGCLSGKQGQVTSLLLCCVSSVTKLQQLLGNECSQDSGSGAQFGLVKGRTQRVSRREMLLRPRMRRQFRVQRWGVPSEHCTWQLESQGCWGRA